jgi:hypothetical protein
VPRLCEFYPGICITTEEKSRKIFSQGKKNLSQVNKNLSQSTVYVLPKHPHITKPTQTHTLQNLHIPTHSHTHTHTHITKQYKTTSVQIKTNTVLDIPKWNNHNIIKCPQYKVTLMYIAPLVVCVLSKYLPKCEQQMNSFELYLLWRTAHFQ